MRSGIGGGKRPRARGTAEQLAAAGLPPRLEAWVRAAIPRRGLWRSERLDVAAELIAHVVDGLEAGVSQDALLAELGDPAVTARMIARAKPRGRPLAWRAAWHGGQAAAVLLLVVYASSAFRLYSARPAQETRPAERAALAARLRDATAGGAVVSRLPLVRAAFDDLLDRTYAADGRLTGAGLRLLQELKGKTDPGLASLMLEPAYFVLPAPRAEVERELATLLRVAATDSASPPRAGRDSALRAALAVRLGTPFWNLRYIPLAAFLPDVAAALEAGARIDAVLSRLSP